MNSGSRLHSCARDCVCASQVILLIKQDIFIAKLMFILQVQLFRLWTKKD